jgi:cysteinyl-tRNA synthetase
LDIGQWAPAELVVPASVAALVVARQQARKDRDYAAADLIRGEIEALGFSVEDTREGPKIAVLAS